MGVANDRHTHQEWQGRPGGTCFTGAGASGAATPKMSIVGGFAGADGPGSVGGLASMGVTGWSEGFTGLDTGMGRFRARVSPRGSEIG